MFKTQISFEKQVPKEYNKSKKYYSHEGGKEIVYEVKVTSKGQVTIPKKLREKIEKYVGILNKEKNSDDVVKELRGHDSSS